MGRLVVLVGVALVAGCKSEAERMVDELSRLTDRMCACEDVACVTAVDRDVAEWQLSHRDELARQRLGNVDPDLHQRGAELDRTLVQCARKVKARAAERAP